MVKLDHQVKGSILEILDSSYFIVQFTVSIYMY